MQRKKNLGNGLDLCVELLLDSVECETVLVSDEIDGDSQMSESPRSPDPVQVSLCVAREIEIDHHIHCLNVNPSCQKI